MLKHCQYLLTLSIFFLTACTQSGSLSPLGPSDTILAFGDSLTRGVGADAQTAYPAVLERNLGITVVNAGVSGEVSAEGLRRLPSELDRHSPKLVILCHGGNDILRDHNPAQTKANLAAMIELIQQRGIEVVLVSVPDRSLFLSPAEFYGELADQYELPIEDDILADLIGDSAMKSDRVHLNAEGYARLASAVAKLLKSRGAL